MRIGDKEYISTSEADDAQLDEKHPDHDPNVVVVSDEEYAAMQRGEDPPGLGKVPPVQSDKQASKAHK